MGYLVDNRRISLLDIMWISQDIIRIINGYLSQRCKRISRDIFVGYLWICQGKHRRILGGDIFVKNLVDISWVSQDIYVRYLWRICRIKISWISKDILRYLCISLCILRYPEISWDILGGELPDGRGRRTGPPQTPTQPPPLPAPGSAEAGPVNTNVSGRIFGWVMTDHRGLILRFVRTDVNDPIFGLVMTN